jgi:hypothetical protein
VLVLSGETTLEQVQRSSIVPDHVVRDLAELGQLLCQAHGAAEPNQSAAPSGCERISGAAEEGCAIRKVIG